MALRLADIKYLSGKSGIMTGKRQCLQFMRICESNEKTGIRIF